MDFVTNIFSFLFHRHNSTYPPKSTPVSPTENFSKYPISSLSSMPKFSSWNFSIAWSPSNSISPSKKYCLRSTLTDSKYSNQVKNPFPLRLKNLKSSKKISNWILVYRSPVFEV